MKIINNIIEFFKSLFKSKNNKQINTMAKKKTTATPTEEEIKQQMINMLCSEEMKMPHKTGSIVNDTEQPLILCSDEEFENHRLNLGEVSMGFPTKMLPYMIAALTELYNRNKEAKFKGDKKAIKKHDDAIAKEIAKIDYFDLSAMDQSEEVKENREKKERMMKVAKKLMSGDLSELTEEDKAEVMQQLSTAASIAQDASEQLDSGRLTPEQMKELKKETNEALKKHMEEVESVLLGKRADKESDIDFEHIKRTFEKHGQAAAKEEIMRCPADKRDAILAQMLDYMKSKQ